MRSRSPLLVAAILLAGACTLPSLSGPEAQQSPSTGWELCQDEARAVLGRELRSYLLECRTVEVPQDWNDPGNGRTMGISVLRARAADQRDRIGSLVVNPGGPGGSGVDLALYLTQGLPAEVTRRFDIVGFDPRGVARSEPIRCYTDADLDASFGGDPDPQSDAEFAEAVALTERMVAGCDSRYGDQLTLFSTEQAANDMDAVRAELDDEQLTYLGYSYGTLLGAVYAQLHPTRVRAMVLDGAVDPTTGSVATSEGQAIGFERAFGNFAGWCTANPERCALTDDPVKVVDRLIAQARERPVGYRDGRSATSGWILWAVVSAMYTESRWPSLATALADLESGDAAGIFRLADAYADRSPDGEYTNLFDANTAVNCADETLMLDVPRVRELQLEWRAKYPTFGAPLALSLLTCAVWNAERDPYPVGPAVGAPPIVVVGTTGDPATPYEQTRRLADMLSVGVVLTWDGEGHTAYPETRCITNYVNEYLIDLAVPADGTICPGS